MKYPDPMKVSFEQRIKIAGDIVAEANTNETIDYERFIHGKDTDVSIDFRNYLYFLLTVERSDLMKIEQKYKETLNKLIEARKEISALKRK